MPKCNTHFLGGIASWQCTERLKHVHLKITRNTDLPWVSLEKKTGARRKQPCLKQTHARVCARQEAQLKLCKNALAKVAAGAALKAAPVSVNAPAARDTASGTCVQCSPHLPTTDPSEPPLHGAPPHPASTAVHRKNSLKLAAVRMYVTWLSLQDMAGESIVV